MSETQHPTFLINQAVAIKKAACCDWFAASSQTGIGSTELGLEICELSSATVFSSVGIDSLMMNRCLGLGIGAAGSDETELDTALDHYRTRKIRRYLIHLAPSDSEARLRNALESRGLERFHRDWVSLARKLDPAGSPIAVPRATDLRVAPLDRQHAAAAAQILTNAFDMPLKSKPLFENVVGREGWHCFGAFDGERLVATGAVYTQGQLACLPFGATLPEARGRGAQAVLMANRVEQARQLGCRLVVTETGVTVPGKPQHSYNNMLRNGFEPLFTCANYGPPNLSW